MASCSILLLICALFLLSTTLLIDASKYDDVRDVHGDSLVPGSCYQIVAVEPSNGGGLILSGQDPQNPNKVCPSKVALRGRGRTIGFPVRVTPEEPTATNVWLEARVNLQFGMPLSRCTSNPWVLRADENDGETYIVQGLKEEKPSFFNFKEVEGEEFTYTLHHCEGPCQQVGIDYVKSTGFLVAGGSTSYSFAFLKSRCHAPAILMPFM